MKPLIESSAVPQSARRQTRPLHSTRSFWQTLQVATKAGLVCHVIFAGLFYRLDMPGMVWANLVSVLLYVGVGVLLNRRHNGKAVLLLLAEVSVHALLAVLMLGWDSGFHSYVLVMLPLIFVSALRHLRHKVVLGAAVLLLYLAMDAAVHGSSPVYAASTLTLNLLRWFNTSTTFLILAYLLHRYYTAVRRAEEQLCRVASTDPLTGALNRRSLLEQRDAGWLVGPASLLIGDIDHFKSINDRCGHDGGDRVLVDVCRTIQASVRPGDMVGRWGGEEFVVLLPDTDAPLAAQVAERIRAALQQLSLRHGDQAVAVSMTFGVATRQPDEAMAACIARADIALYAGKSAGRNRVVSAA